MNQIDFASSYGPTSFMPNNNQSFLNSYNEVGSYYCKNIEEEAYISQSFLQEKLLRADTPLSLINMENQKRQEIKNKADSSQDMRTDTLRESFTNKQVSTKHGNAIVTINSSSVKINGKGQKIKNQTEPNSPRMKLSQGTFDNQVLPRQKVIVNNSQTKIDPKELQLRLSANKISLFKHQYGQQKNQKQLQSKAKRKTNNNTDVNNILGCLTPSSENSSQHNKQNRSSFLPKLDKPNINSQVLYVDLQHTNKSDIKERVDISARSPTNNWIRELSYDQKLPTDKKHNNLQNINNVDFDKIFTPSKNNNPNSSRFINNNTTHNNNNNTHSSSGKADTSYNNSKFVKNSQKNNFNNLFQNQASANGTPSINNSYDLQSPDYAKNNQKVLSDYFHSKNIGKIQPMYEMKNIINEQVIRNKLNKVYQLQNVTSTTNNSSNFHNVFNQANAVANGIQSEVVSPKVSPTFSKLNEQFKPMKRKLQIHDQLTNNNFNSNNTVRGGGGDYEGQILNLDNNLTLSKFFQQRSGSQCSSKFELNSDKNEIISDKLIANQFHQRTSSVAQPHKENLQALLNTQSQFNTIEEVMRNSKDNLNFKEYMGHSNLLEQKIYNIEQQQLGMGGNTNSSNASSNVHLPIKPVASKQMPKCFRMSKQQIQSIHRVYRHGKDPGQKVFSQISQRGTSIERKSEDQNESISQNNYQNNCGKVGSSNIFLSKQNQGGVEGDISMKKKNLVLGDTQEIYRERIMETEEEERARMTPAFNERVRDSYTKVK